VVQATPTQATPVKEPQTPAQPTQPAKVNETPKPKNDVSKLREAVERKSSPTPKTTSNNTISIKKPNTRGVFGKERDKILENYKKKLQEAQSSQPQAKPQEEPVNQTPVVKEVKPTNISSFGSMSITNQKKVLPSLTKADLEHVLARALKRIEKPRKEGTHGSQYLKNQEERQEIIPLIRKRIEELEDNLKKNK
jgi:hypothetical protein